MEKPNNETARKGIQIDGPSALIEVPVGAIIETTDGRRLKVSENPQDGIWVIARAVEQDDTLAGEEMVFVSDIV